MAAKWYASGNYFSTKAWHQLNWGLGEQSLLPKDYQNQFVEIESLELEEIWFNSWRWGFKFKNGLQSDFDTDCVLKKFRLPFDHPHIHRVEIHSVSWSGKEHYLCGLKFFDK